jgi:hypothetical protein
MKSAVGYSKTHALVTLRLGELYHERTDVLNSPNTLQCKMHSSAFSFPTNLHLDTTTTTPRDCRMCEAREWFVAISIVLMGFALIAKSCYSSYLEYTMERAKQEAAFSLDWPDE